MGVFHEKLHETRRKRLLAREKKQLPFVYVEQRKYSHLIPPNAMGRGTDYVAFIRYKTLGGKTKRTVEVLGPLKRFEKLLPSSQQERKHILKMVRMKREEGWPILRSPMRKKRKD
jgi:hypothetical protein